jgi:Uma2 family endonuclease
MSAGTSISVEEYLHTSYRPDRDYIEGEVLERNVGEWDHSRLQTVVAVWFFAREAHWKLRTVVEQRVQVKSDRFRIPDVCLVRESQVQPILKDPPVLCIEVLSKDDTVRSMQARIDDYLRFGVPTVWVLDPAARRGFIYTPDGMHEAKDRILRAVNPGYPDIELPISELAE